MNFRMAALVAAAVALTVPAAAQSFTQAIVFGDSTVDSGFYKALPSPGAGPTFNAAWPAAVAAGAGAPTTNPGLMNSQVLAAYFGLSANPANQPGGTNFATSGAKNILVNDGTNGGFQAAIPTVTQIANYLAANGGRANPNGLYLISAGGNDVAYAFSGLPGSPATQAARIAYLTNAANGLSAAVSSLRNAGARTIIVPGQNFSFPANNAAERDARLAYTQALWSGLAAAGVNFIPADFNAVRVAIANNPLAFGFTNGVGNGINSTACVAPAGITTAYALLCSSNPAAPSHFRTADADRTFLFADDQHLTSAGQKIEADYFYSLIVAPIQISLLAENAVASRSATVAGIQEQIDIARRRPNAGLNLWISGDIASLKISNPAAGFPGDSGTPFSGTVGMDYKWHNGALFGAAITTGTQTPGFELGGRFKQKEIAGSLYGETTIGQSWASMIGTYGALRYDVNRIVPIGITLQDNRGSTNGSDISLAVQAGSDFRIGGLTHGPVIGLILQRVKVDGFTEAGNFTSLAFGSQTRDSAVSTLGYKAGIDVGLFRPFAQIVWDHELASTDRLVRASLTTIAAPSYEMPAVSPGKDWATATVGTTARFTSGLTGLASITTQIGHSGVATYGGRVGLNYVFN